MQKLAAQGMSKAAIGRKLGLHLATVRKLVNARSLEDSDTSGPTRSTASATACATSCCAYHWYPSFSAQTR